jgi:hypothetical protein
MSTVPPVDVPPLVLLLLELLPHAPNATTAAATKQLEKAFVNTGSSS